MSLSITHALHSPFSTCGSRWGSAMVCCHISRSCAYHASTLHTSMPPVSIPHTQVMCILWCSDGGGRGRGRGLGGRGGRGGRGQGGPSASEDVYKIVKLIKARNFQPVIVFSFNRRCSLSCLPSCCSSCTSLVMLSSHWLDSAAAAAAAAAAWHTTATLQWPAMYVHTDCLLSICHCASLPNG